MSAPPAARARAWAEHVRAGGTRSFAQFMAGSGTVPAGAGEPAEPGDAVELPAAQPLALLRELNRHRTPSARLAARVLDASPPGRGRPPSPLPGAPALGRFAGRFAPAPVDPDTVGAEELLRYAAGLLAERLAATGPAPAPRAWARPWRTPYRLAGDPWLVHAAAEELTARGRPPTPRPVPVLLLAAPLDTLLGDVWTARSFGLNARAWSVWRDTALRHDWLPPHADLAALAARHAAEVGAERVSVVLDPSLLAAEVGTRRPLPPAPAVHPVAADLARRVARFLGLYLTRDERRAVLRRRLLPQLAALQPADDERLPLGPEHRAWLRGRAETMAEQLAEGGYRLLGDPAALRPAPEQPGRAADLAPERALDLAARLLLTTDASEEGR